MSDIGALPKFTLVVPSLNQSSFLPLCLQSIVDQDYPPEKIELIVMDGGSSDSSVEVIRCYESRIFYWQSQPDGGQSQAINEGISRGSGDLVAWLNSDDFYLPNSLRAVARQAERTNEVECFHGSAYRWYCADQRLSFLPSGRASLGLLRSFGNYVVQPACFWTRAWWEKLGGLNPELELVLDFEFHLRSIASGARYKFMREAMAVIIQHDHNKSIKLDQREELTFLKQQHYLLPSCLRVTWGKLLFSLAQVAEGNHQYVWSALGRRLNRSHISGVPLKGPQVAEVLTRQVVKHLRSIGCGAPLE